MASSAATAATSPDDERVQTIIFMRHGVAAHNFEGADLYSPSLFDPALTLQGKMSAMQAGDKIRTWWRANPNGSGNTVDLILTSPLTRCLQTTLHAFLPGDDYYDRGSSSGGWVPVLCVENLREACGKHYPDKRREKSILQKFWGPMVQFDESMPEKDERWSPTSREGWDELGSRIDAFLQWIVQRREENIMVVSHGVWIEDLLRRHQPNFLGDRRVYNLDAFAMQCMSQKSTRRFLRLQNVTKIV